MVQKLEPLPSDIEIYAPFGISKIETSTEYLKSQTIDIQTDGKKLCGIHQNWPLVLYLVQCLNKSKFSLPGARTVFQKI